MADSVPLYSLGPSSGVRSAALELRPGTSGHRYLHQSGIFQLLAIRKVAQGFQPEYREELLRRHERIGRSAAGGRAARFRSTRAHAGARSDRG